MPKHRTKEVGAFVPIEEFNEFKANFPQYGSTQWLIIGAMRSVNALVRTRPEMKDVVAHAIEELLLEKQRSKIEHTPAGTGQAAG